MICSFHRVFRHWCGGCLDLRVVQVPEERDASGECPTRVETWFYDMPGSVTVAEMDRWGRLFHEAVLQLIEANHAGTAVPPLPLGWVVIGFGSLELGPPVAEHWAP